MSNDLCCWCKERPAEFILQGKAHICRKCYEGAERRYWRSNWSKLDGTCLQCGKPWTASELSALVCECASLQLERELPRRARRRPSRIERLHHDDHDRRCDAARGR